MPPPEHYPRNGCCREQRSWVIRRWSGRALRAVRVSCGCHEDGGDLVRKLYGHRDRSRALDRAVRAYEEKSRVTLLRPVARHCDQHGRQGDGGTVRSKRRPAVGGGGHLGGALVPAEHQNGHYRRVHADRRQRRAGHGAHCRGPWSCSRQRSQRCPAPPAAPLTTTCSRGRCRRWPRTPPRSSPSQRRRSVWVAPACSASRYRRAPTPTR